MGNKTNLKCGIKRPAAVLAAAALAAALCLAGCGASDSSKGSGGETLATGSGNGASAASGSGYTGGTYNIIIGLVTSEDHSISKMCEEFKKVVEEKSDGKITVDIHLNSELGGDEAMMESVALGTLTMTTPSATLISSYVPEFQVLGMPYLFKDSDTAFKTIDGELGTLLNQKLAAANVGFTNLGYEYNGVREMTNNRRPIKTPDDLKGLKMRCMSNDIYVDMFKTLGSNATPISYNELFTALQQKTVDGEENTPSLIYDSKFYEVQKYLSTTEHMYDLCAVVINTNFYDSLDPQAKAIIDEATKDILIKKQRVLEASQDEDALKKLEAAGMEVTRLTPQERQVFADKVQPMYSGWDKEYGQDIVDAVNKYR